MPRDVQGGNDMAAVTCTKCAKPVQARGLCIAHYAKWRRDQPDRCRYCGGALENGQPISGRLRRTHESCLVKRRGFWADARRDVMAAYGGACACCGETTDQFLTIDHVNDDGVSDRRAIGGGSNRMWFEIRRRGYPDRYRILCWNCNLGRARNGGVCPHVQAGPLRTEVDLQKKRVVP